MRPAGGAGDQIEDEGLEEEYIGPSMVDFQEGRLVWDGESVVECGEFMKVNRGRVEGWLEELRRSEQIDANNTLTPQSSPTSVHLPSAGSLRELQIDRNHNRINKTLGPKF